MTRIGLAIPPSVPPEDVRALVLAAAEEVDEVWFSEDCFNAGGLTQATAALAWTEGSTLVVGAGLLPAPLHPVTAAAMDLATLARAFPGRLRPTIGSGIAPWMAQAGVAPRSRIGHLGEYLTALRALLDGEEVTAAGDFVRLDGVKLALPPTDRLPLLVGGAGPRTLALAADIADGTSLSLGVTRTEAAEFARAAAPDHAVLVPLLTSLASGARERVDATFSAYGIEPDDDRGYAGDVAGLTEVASQLGEAGVETVVVQPTGDEPDLIAFARSLGEVRAGSR